MAAASRRVARFFDEQLPAAIAISARTFAQTQGALTLIIEGAGSWTVTFGDASSPAALVDEADIDADCISVWTAESFAALLDAKPGRGQKGLRPLALLGETRLLGRLGALLGPRSTHGGVGARLSAVAR
ncbi:MAG: hypothetical protein IT382_16535 [Deltaproteobacteria bacterium]|jgi:hypothetical protein|nr:hypothetical protein [Deltaproteobacteria bacterium]